MAALIRQANNWNQNGQMERMVKATKEDHGERGMKKNPLLPPDQKPYMYGN